MTSFSEQLSTVRKSQWEAQLEMFSRLSSRALDSTEQLIALNLKASRASMEHAAGTMKQLLEVSDPRDLLALGSVAHNQWHQLFSYGRELLGIATGLRSTWSTLPPTLPQPAALRLLPSPNTNIPASFGQASEQAAIATADALTITSEIGAAAADIGSALTEAALDAGTVQPAPAPAQATAPLQAAAAPATEAAALDAAIETAIADDVPPAEVKPLAKALNEVAPKPASVEHPIVSTVPLQAEGQVALPAVAPVEHTAPAPAPAAKPPRASRRK